MIRIRVLQDIWKNFASRGGSRSRGPNYTDPYPYLQYKKESGRISLQSTQRACVKKSLQNRFINHRKLITHSRQKSSVSDPDPFGTVSFWSAGSGSASMKRIRIRVAKNQPKSWKILTKIIKISYMFFKTIELMFTDINIYSINNKTDHISEKYIFYIKKVDIFPILGRIWSRIRIRIRYFTKQIRGSGSISK